MNRRLLVGLAVSVLAILASAVAWSFVQKPSGPQSIGSQGAATVTQSSLPALCKSTESVFVSSSVGYKFCFDSTTTFALPAEKSGWETSLDSDYIFFGSTSDMATTVPKNIGSGTIQVLNWTNGLGALVDNLDQRSDAPVRRGARTATYINGYEALQVSSPAINNLEETFIRWTPQQVLWISSYSKNPLDRATYNRILQTIQHL